MNDETKFEAVHVDAGPVATIEEATAAKLKLLDENEIVELSIKPSLWFIPIASAPVLVVACALVVTLTIAARDGGSLIAAYCVPVAVLAAFLRLVVASLQWASQVYVLTNRRVMRFSGVLNVSIDECRLVRVGRTNLQIDALQRTLRLGSICITPAGQQKAGIVWEHVPRASEVYAKVIRMIKKAQSKR